MLKSKLVKVGLRARVYEFAAEWASVVVFAGEFCMKPSAIFPPRLKNNYKSD